MARLPLAENQLEAIPRKF